MIKTPIKAILDDAFAAANAKRKSSLPPLAHIVVATKSGKTEKINQWLEENHVDFVRFNASRRKLQSISRKVNPEVAFPAEAAAFNTMTQEKVNYVFREEEIAEMSKPGKVIFIDNYDWASLETRQQLLDLICHSKIVDPSVKTFDHKRVLDGIKMIIVVTHPTQKEGIEAYSDIEQRIFGQQD